MFGVVCTLVLCGSSCDVFLFKRYDEGMPFFGRRYYLGGGVWSSMVELLTSNRFYLLRLVTLYFDGLLTWRRNWDRVSSCKLQLHFESVCDSLCYSGCSILWQWIAHGVLIETESCRAIYNCTVRVSVTGPTTGLSNPCPDTQHLLCLVMYCSRGGEIGTESHRANYNCTLRVSVTVFATAAVQSFDNGLLKW
jgi:hypothetical protein